MNYEFLPDNYILENIMTISTIPTVIVHGRYDINCPLGKAYDLKEQINNCELIIIPLCGHKFTAEGEVIQRVAYENFLKKLNQVSY